MCWLITHTPSVPTCSSTSAAARRPRANRVTLQIQLTPRDAAATSIMIERPLNAFYALRNDLMRLTRTPSQPTRGPRWMRRVVKRAAPTSACTCEAPGPCPFTKLHHAIQALAPLPPCTKTFRPFQTQHTSIDDYHIALETWLQAVHGLFKGEFSGAFLQSMYQREHCAVMNVYAAFFDAKDHFPIVDTTAMRRPLALRAWRAEREQAALDDISLLEEDDMFDDEADFRDAGLRTPTTPIPVIEEPEDPSTRLPRLDVKRVGLATLQTFLEDFCETILAQHGQDIVELQSPELTMARRWEIGLYVACRLGHSYGAQLILFYYADANVALDDGTSCLHIAARMGRASIVSLLVQEGADVDQPNDDGITPLIAACRNGCLEVTKLLLAAGANVNAASERGTQAIHAAIVSENPEVVQLLLNNGANVRATTSSGLTPLHFAARLGNVALSELLLKHNADPEQQTKSGSDAIMIATTNGHVEICELFQKEMDRKNFLSSSGGKLFHRFKKTTPVLRPSDMRRRGESHEDAISVILMHQTTTTTGMAARRTIVV